MTRLKITALTCAILMAAPALANDPHYGWIELTVEYETLATAQITHPYGIEKVVRESESPLGRIERKEISAGCASSVQMRWRRTAPDATLKVTPCAHPTLDASDFRSFDSIAGAFLDEHFEVAFSDADRDGVLESATVRYAPLHYMVFEINPGTSMLEDLQCESVAVCESMAAYCDANDGVGTCYDDHCECDLP